MKLACIADVHLDAAFVQLGPQLARARRQAIRDSLLAALRRAQEEGAEALLVAGDLYEHDRATADTGNFLRDAFREISPMRVFLAPGNHDWLGPESLYRLVDWSPNVHVFETEHLEPIALADGLTLWGGAHLAPAGTAGFLDGFAAPDGGIHMALFHGSERGEFHFQSEEKVLHAPFTDHSVRAAGLAHAFVGHYHTPIDGSSHTYPGSLEPLSFGETEPGGIVIAELSTDGCIERQRIVVSPTRVWDERVDVTGATNAQAVLERVRARLAGKHGLARVTLHGSLDPDVDLQLEDVARAADALDHVAVRTESLFPAYDLEAIAQEQTVRGQFVRDLEQADLDSDLKRRAMIIGLRALEGRDDLEVSG